jgi:hypothetical protein
MIRVCPLRREIGVWIGLLGGDRSSPVRLVAWVAWPVEVGG